MFFDELGVALALASLLASLFLVAAFVIALFRVVRGPTAFDRVLALELIGGLCICIIVIFAIYFNQPVLLDAAFVIAIVSFIGTVAFARTLGKGAAE